jgi:hypothetical protein
MKNIHLPLPDDAYLALRAEAQKEQMPATSMARVAIQAWLAERKRAKTDEEIRVYARAMAGTGADLDRDLEAASLDHLTAEERG